MLEMTYVGRDSRDRPVYKDGSGKLWKDTDPRSHVPPSLFSCADNVIDGKPDKPYLGKVKLLPKRVTW